jgi:hypothetical protein
MTNVAPGKSWPGGNTKGGIYVSTPMTKGEAAPELPEDLADGRGRTGMSPVQRRSKDAQLPAADDVIEGTIVRPGVLNAKVNTVRYLTPHERARVLTDRIRQGLKDIVALRKLIIEAFTSRAWETLGYESWDAYCGSEFRVISLGREHQAALNAALQLEAGMSARAAAAATGTDHKTAKRDADRWTGEDSPVGSATPPKDSPVRRIGADGKSRPAARKQPSLRPRLKADPPDINAFAGRVIVAVRQILSEGSGSTGKQIQELLPHQDKVAQEVREELADELEALAVRATRYATIFRTGCQGGTK